jgi:hypothetical protein
MTSDQPWWLTWPVAEVAAAILPVFSHPQFSPSKSELYVRDDIVAWCKTGRFTERKFGIHLWADPYADPDYRAINEAIQVLEQTRLMVRSHKSSEGASSLGLTRLGMHALQTNTVRQHLGFADSPPPVSN